MSCSPRSRDIAPGDQIAIQNQFSVCSLMVQSHRARHFLLLTGSAARLSDQAATTPITRHPCNRDRLDISSREPRLKAVEISLLSLARAAPIGWQRWQRKIDIFATFEVYRPKDRSERCSKSWIPLSDNEGVPLYPELMAELDAIKMVRIAGRAAPRLGQA
jgi:hypothetical protein